MTRRDRRVMSPLAGLRAITFFCGSLGYCPIALLGRAKRAPRLYRQVERRATAPALSRKRRGSEDKARVQCEAGISCK
jgi:hypothetical protein